MSTSSNQGRPRAARSADPLAKIPGLSDPPRLDDAEELSILLAAAPRLVKRKRLADRLWALLLEASLDVDDALLRRGVNYPAACAGAEAVHETARKRARADGTFGDRLGLLGYNWMLQKQWTRAIALFDLLIDSDKLALSTYNNALYAVMADNNGQPVDAERTRRFISRCLPHGPQNPSIFYNVACLYTELDDPAQTFAHIALALEHGYPRPEQIKDEGLFARYADDPGFQALFQKR